MNAFEWFQFNCDRSTFSVTVQQPDADNILAVLEAVVRLRDGKDTDTEGLFDAIDKLRGTDRTGANEPHDFVGDGADCKLCGEGCQYYLHTDRTEPAP